MRRQRKPTSTTDPDDQVSRLRARTPADLLGVVPYLLGFHPTESLVLVLLGARHVVMTARMDLAALADPVELAAYLEDLRRGQQAAGLIIIAYSRSEQARSDTLRLAAELDDAVLVDALLADGERWWSVLCDGVCCPAEGTPYDATSDPLSAAAVYAGLSALPDRQALEALVAGPRDTDVRGLEVLADDTLAELAGTSVGTRKRLVRRLIQQLLTTGPGTADDSAAFDHPVLSDAESIRLAVLVHNIEVRDVAWAQLTREQADLHVALWQHVVVRTPPWLAPAPLCLLGISAWVAGNGALQNCCIERVERIDPDYSMASLLADINRRALPPSYWDQLLREFRRHPDMLAG